MPPKDEIKACPKCGSMDISGLRHIRDWLKRSGPTMGIYTCQKCGYEGLPIVFDSEKEHKRFLDLTKGR